MGGLLVLFLLGFYVWGAYKIVRWIKPVWGKALVLVAVLLIPTADAVYGRIKLKQMCETEGGLKIYKTAQWVEGFRDGRSRPEEEWVIRYGYRFVEGEGANGKPARVSRQANGTVRMENNITPISRYAFEREGNDIGHGFRSGEYRVVDIVTNERLGVYINFGYEGGWIERFVAEIYAAKGFAGDCGFGDSWQITLKLIQTTLKTGE